MAMTTRHVTTTGAGSHDGTTLGNAYSFTEMATAINGGASAGYEYLVHSGAYSLSATTTITSGGTTTSPLVIRGCDSASGDATLGRTTYGVLDTSNMPTVAYDAGHRLTISADYVVIEALSITTAISGSSISSGNDHVSLVNCKIANTSTNAAAAGPNLYGSRPTILECDLSTGASGGDNCALLEGNGSWIEGCRCTSPGGAGIKLGANATCIGNTVYDCGGDGIKQTTNNPSRISGNTIYGCTGDGIDIVNTCTNPQDICGNHITDNGGYGINFNGATCAARLFANRFRDNTSGATSGAADWVSGTNSRAVTTDTGGASTDYTDAATNKDFSLIADAPGNNTGVGFYRNIGAAGTPEAAASSGGLKGYASA